MTKLSSAPRGEIVVYEMSDGAARVDVRLERDTVWLTQPQMAELFGRKRSVVTKHIRSVFREGELDRQAVCAKFARTAEDGKSYQVEYYNLDAIISVGDHVNSIRGTQFRILATRTLTSNALVTDDCRPVLDGVYWNDRLALELHRRGIRHLSTGALEPDAHGPSIRTTALLQGLAGSNEARLRSALIPLLLRWPELAKDTRLADPHLFGTAQITLRSFYTAAAIVQRQHATRLRQLFGAQAELPDLFSTTLSLPSTVPLIDLMPSLAARSAERGEPSVDWRGTYEHAAESYLKMAEAEAAWSPA